MCSQNSVLWAIEKPIPVWRRKTLSVSQWLIRAATRQAHIFEGERRDCCGWGGAALELLHSFCEETCCVDWDCAEGLGAGSNNCPSTWFWFSSNPPFAHRYPSLLHITFVLSGDHVDHSAVDAVNTQLVPTIAECRIRLKARSVRWSGGMFVWEA